jgi:hypothetical protein
MEACLLFFLHELFLQTTVNKCFIFLTIFFISVRCLFHIIMVISDIILDSLISAMAVCRLDDQGSILGRGRFFSSFPSPVKLWTPKASYPMGAVSSPGVKWQKCEADQSSLSRAQIKNACSYTSTPPHIMVPSLIKDRVYDNRVYSLSLAGSKI